MEITYKPNIYFLVFKIKNYLILLFEIVNKFIYKKLPKK